MNQSPKQGTLEDQQGVLSISKRGFDFRRLRGVKMTSGLILFSRFPSFQPAQFALPEGVTTVGRSSASNFVIRHETVSRQHAELTIRGLNVTVRDLGSSNGTLVDGKRIERSPVVVGQQLQFGQVGFLLSTPEVYDSEVESTMDSPEGIDFKDLMSQVPEINIAAITPGQRRVLEMLLAGLSEKEVAKKLRIRRNTVHSHVKNVYLACGVHSRAELLARFLKRNEFGNLVNG